MFKTALACLATAAICLTVTATTGFGSDGIITVRAGSGGARFPVTDVFCVAEAASGTPRFREPGVACSSYKQPYKGVGVWFAAHRVVITSPPNGRAIYSVRR
jgi:hypothetical protein